VAKIHSPEGKDANLYNIAALLSQTDIVASGVRIASTRCTNEQGHHLADKEVLEKDQFSRILKTKVLVDKEVETKGFLEGVFLPMIEGKPSELSGLFSRLGELLQYQGGDDNGLPPHALWLLDRPLIQILLFWLSHDHPSSDNQRAELIRFVLFWNLCVTKKPKASTLAYSLIRDEKEKTGSSPFLSLYRKFVEEGVALRLYSPEQLEGLISGILHCHDDQSGKPFLGWTRFLVPEDEPDERKAARLLYQRWWNSGNSVPYHHLMLLWLQREYVNTLGGSPVAGREEDTPYDYDHILPGSHWNGWGGQHNSTDRILDFMPQSDVKQQYVTGNSIGNLRVWSSSDNRSDGDDSPKKKLMAQPDDWRNSAITEADKELWCDCSRDGDQKMVWSVERATAFQKAVENRTFSLYEKFFDEADFTKWIF